MPLNLISDVHEFSSSFSIIPFDDLYILCFRSKIISNFFHSSLSNILHNVFVISPNENGLSLINS